MAEIAPFQGLRYNLEKIERLEQVTAPPYDVISPEMREALYDLSPYNVIRLILGKDEANDGPKNNRYTRAAEFLKTWQEQKILIRDTEPAIYGYYMDFDQKISGRIKRTSRKGFVARLKLSSYQDGMVLPHERTLRGPKEDRLLLLRHCRANFSQVFCLFQEKKHTIYSLLDHDIRLQNPVQFTDQQGVRHSLWPITRQPVINRIIKLMKPKPVIIADGHHRYETGLSYLRHLERKLPLLVGSAGYITAYFTQASDPGLILYPYHRIIRNLPKSRFRGLAKKLAEFLNVEKSHVSPLVPGRSRVSFMEELGELGRNQPAFGMTDMEKRESYYLTLKPEIWTGPENPSLDVIVLEELILKDILRIPAKALFEEKYVSYETDYDHAVERAQADQAQMIFFLNPIPIKQVIDRALNHRVMPEKSTYFYPKLASGLVMNMLDD
jgi:uncharacterized protein (DUF1015 family)